MDSRQVAYLPVFELVAPLLGDPGVIPGTPQWVGLPDDNPDKWRAILWAAVWWTVAEDARQAAMAEASRSVAASANWSQIGKPRPGSYVERVA
ncbi:MAG: DUF2742 domain-containing protein [Mycobacterium sp.]